MRGRARHEIVASISAGASPRQGTVIPTNDMWLAALVLQHNLVLHARDKHFDRLSQLARA